MYVFSISCIFSESVLYDKIFLFKSIFDFNGTSNFKIQLFTKLKNSFKFVGVLILNKNRNFKKVEYAFKKQLSKGIKE